MCKKPFPPPPSRPLVHKIYLSAGRQKKTNSFTHFYSILYIKNTAKRNMSSAVCLPAMCKSSLFLRLSSLSSSIEDRLPSKGVFHQRLSSIEGHLPLRVIFHQKFVFHQMSSSIKCCLPSKVVFNRRSSSIEGRLPSKVVFHRRLSSIEDCLPY